MVGRGCYKDLDYDVNCPSTRLPTQVLAAQQRYEVGLDKLDFTAGQVDAMRQELRALKPVLEKTVGETEALMERIAREKIEVVEPKKAVVDEEVKQVGQMLLCGYGTIL